jgi:hypothetical protein
VRLTIPFVRSFVRGTVIAGGYRDGDTQRCGRLSRPNTPVTASLSCNGTTQSPSINMAVSDRSPASHRPIAFGSTRWREILRGPDSRRVGTSPGH